MEKKFCENCGQELSLNAKFCSACGAKCGDEIILEKRTEDAPEKDVQEAPSYVCYGEQDMFTRRIVGHILGAVIAVVLFYLATYGKSTLKEFVWNGDLDYDAYNFLVKYSWLFGLCAVEELVRLAIMKVLSGYAAQSSILVTNSGIHGSAYVSGSGIVPFNFKYNEFIIESRRSFFLRLKQVVITSRGCDYIYYTSKPDFLIDKISSGGKK